MEIIFYLRRRVLKIIMYYSSNFLHSNLKTDKILSDIQMQEYKQLIINYLCVSDLDISHLLKCSYLNLYYIELVKKAACYENTTHSLY